MTRARATVAAIGLGGLALAGVMALPRPVETQFAYVAGSTLTPLIDGLQENPADSVEVIDGDTIKLYGERIRLNGIDAPEMPGHCRKGRACVPGDPLASRDSLAVGLATGKFVTINRLKFDHYGRTVAQVKVGDLDLSCWQIARGAARYVARWDEGSIMDGACE